MIYWEHRWPEAAKSPASVLVVACDVSSQVLSDVAAEIRETWPHALVRCEPEPGAEPDDFLVLVADDIDRMPVRRIRTTAFRHPLTTDALMGLFSHRSRRLVLIPGSGWRPWRWQRAWRKGLTLLWRRAGSLLRLPDKLI